MEDPMIKFLQEQRRLAEARLEKALLDRDDFHRWLQQAQQERYDQHRDIAVWKERYEALERKLDRVGSQRDAARRAALRWKRRHTAVAALSEALSARRKSSYAEPEEE